MKGIYTLTLFICLSIFFNQRALAQCSTIPCPTPIPQPNPANACILPSELSLNCYEGATTGTTPVAFPPFWCTTIENNHFFAFTATNTTVNFEIECTGCTTGNGIQAAVLETTDCVNFNFVSPCLGGINAGSTQTLTASPLVPGQVYYLMFDGQGGAQCNYTINGEQSNISGAPTELCIPSNFQGAYSSTALSEWTINPPTAGVILGSPISNTVIVNWVETGNHTICAQALACPGTPPECLEILVGEDVQTQQEEDICLGGTQICGGQSFSAPGVYFITYETWQGCDSLITCILNPIPPVITDPFEEDLCGPTFYEVCGNFYSQSGIYTATCQNYQGCDSLVTVDLAIMEPIPVIAPPDELGCDDDASLVLDGTGSNFNLVPNGTTTYFWTGPGIVGLDDQPTVEINQPGTYCLELTFERNGVFCTETDCVEVEQSIEFPDPPSISGPDEVCDGDMENYIVSPNGSVNVISYTWTTPNGEPTTQVNSTTITVDWTGSPGGDLCVVAEGECGPSDPTCITVIVSTGPEEPIIDGPDQACDGDMATYEITNPTPDATSTWTVPPGASFVVNGESIDVDFTGATSGDVCVTCENDCGTTDEVCITVTINTPPDDPVISGESEVCDADVENYCVSPDPNVIDYTWETPAGTFPNEADCFEVDWNGLNSGNVCVTAHNDCGESEKICFPVTVNVSPTATLSGGGEFCEGSGNMIDLSVELTGVAPWTLEYNDGTNPPVTVNNIMTSPHTISVGSAGTYALNNVMDATDCDGIVDGQADVIENPLPTVQLSGSGDICEGSNETVELTINLTGTPNWTVGWTVNGDPQADLNNISSSPFTLTITEAQAGDIELVSVMDGNGCENIGDGNVINITVNDAPAVSNIATTCNGTNTGYVLTFEISGGDPASYSVVSNILGHTGTLTDMPPYIFTSAEIPNGDGYEFVVTDANDCNPTTVEDDIVLCDCTTTVGDMDLAEIEQCGSDAIDANYDNSTEVLDADDIVEFILHEGSGNSIINPIDTNSTPNFGFQPGMTFGTTYYISAIAGNNVNGHVDQSEPCLDISQGTPVVFHEIPSAFMIGDVEICEGETTGLSIEFTGVGPWSLNYEDGTGIQTINGINANPFTLDVTPNATTTYTLDGVSDVNCPGEVDGAIEVTVHTAVEINNLEVTCNATSTAYVVTFEISGGDPTSYIVTGAPGITNNTTPPYTFTSDELPASSGFSIDVDDANSCDPQNVAQTQVVCNCLTDVGTMDLNAMDECSDGPVLAIYDNANQNLDGDDVLNYILHTGNLTLGNILQTNVVEPNFGFDPMTMSYGTTYYISTIVGNDDGTGMVDIDDPCLAFAQGTPVTFFEVPTGFMSGQEAICDGEDANLMVELTGDSPWSIVINGQTISDIVSSPYQFNATPGSTTNYVLEAVNDENCVGTFAGDGTITVNNAPTVSNLMIECNVTNTAYTVTFEIEGGDNSCYTIGGNSGTLNGNVFTSNPINSGNGYFFSIDDCNECGPLVAEEDIIICDCETLAGDMEGIAEDVCGNGPAMANYQGGEVLDGDDVLCFMIHDGSFVPLAVNSMEPSFSFQQANMVYGQSYYICAMAGNVNANGCVSQSDPCLSISNICKEVIFYQIPTVSMSGGGTICEGETIDLNFTMTGGDPPYTITYQEVATGTDFTEVSMTNSHTVTLNPTSGTTYSLVSFEDANCPGTMSGAASVTVNTPPTYMVNAETCNDDNTGYTVSFTVQTLNPDIIINPPGSGVLNGNVFTSNEIDISQGYAFEIDDGNGCGPVFLADDPPICQCITFPGTMNNVLATACETDQITAPHNGNEVLDADDVLGYYLHGQIGGDYNTALAYSDQPTFSFDPGTMTSGLSYYICVAAGNDDGTGNPDPNDPCFLTGNCTPVFWYPNPTADITGTTTICEGESTDITFSLTGVPPHQIEYLENGTVQTITVWSNDTTITVFPNAAYNMTLVSVTSLVGPTVQCFNTANAVVDIAISTVGNSGTAGSPIAVCENENQTINLDNLLIAADAGGQWKDQNNIDIGNTFNTFGQAAGTYTFTYTITPQAPCPQVSTQVEVIINPLPTADAGPDQQLNCDDTVAELGGTGTSTGDFTYTWTGGNVANAGAITTTTSNEGTYNLLVTNNVTGCTISDEVVITVDNSPPVPTITFSDLSCFEADDGFISVAPITGGAPPYTCSINGGAFTDQTTFTNLTAGTYTIICRDSKGCEVEIPVSIGQPDELDVEIIGQFQGDDTFVNLGDSVLISAQINLPFDSLDLVVWNPNEAIPCDTCSSFYLTPTDQITISIQVQDGVCSDNDDLTVFVRKDRPVYVPNAFSPNGDGTNDVFEIYTGNSVAKIHSFLVFNRWGETVHQYYDFDPNNPAAGWDGLHKGEPLNPAVFTWFAEIEFIDGIVELYEGDVTLVR